MGGDDSEDAVGKAKIESHSSTRSGERVNEGLEEDMLEQQNEDERSRAEENTRYEGTPKSERTSTKKENSSPRLWTAVAFALNRAG